MAQEPLATSDELNLWTRQTVDGGLAALVLSMVSSAVVAAAGPSAADWDPDTVPGQAKLVVLTAAGRVISNPGGLKSETIGAYSYTAGDTGGLLTAAETAALEQLTGGAVTGMGVVSVQVTVPPMESGF